MTVDIVIPTYQNRSELLRCLEALEGQLGAEDRVLVCVDGSTDGTQAALRDRTWSFSLIVLEHPDHANHGRAATRNLALPHLRADFVLMLDSDMELEPVGRKAHEAVVTCPNVVSVGDVRHRNASTSAWARYLESRGRSGSPAGRDVQAIHVNTQNLALRTADLRAVGGFDESLLGYGGEDTELGLRLAERGLQLHNTKDAVAWTDEPKTLDQALAELDAYARTNLRAIRARHPAGPAPYWLDRLERRGISGRAIGLAMNPVTDLLAGVCLRIAPWSIRRRAIDYLVLRTVWRGYREGPR